MVDALRLTHQIVEVVVRAPLAARNFHPGEFYRLQNYETFAEEVDGIKLTMEGIALTGAWVDRERGLISLIVLEMGGSSRLCSLLEPGEKVVLMGPTGTPTEIPHNQTVVLAGGGLGNAVLFSIALALKENNNRVIYFAGYRTPTDLFKRHEIEKACDVVVWSTDRGPCIQPARPQDRTFVGNIVEAMQAYASGQLGEQPIPLADAQRIIAIGSDRMMAAVKNALADQLQPHFPNQPTAIGSINSPMQCMMKEICAQCLQRHVDPETKKESFVFSCFNQDQLLRNGRFRQPEHPPPPEQRRGEADVAVDRSPVLGAAGADGLSTRTWFLGRIHKPELASEGISQGVPSLVLWACANVPRNPVRLVNKRTVDQDGNRDDLPVDFWRLAQLLSTVYPLGTEAKRRGDAVLDRKKGLGFFADFPANNEALWGARRSDHVRQAGKPGGSAAPRRGGTAARQTDAAARAACHRPPGGAG